MKIRSVMPLVAVAVLCCSSAFPATLPGVGVREAARVGFLENLSVGVTTDWLRRDVKLSGSSATLLEARTLSFFAGYDVSSWMTVFGTLGSTEMRFSDAGDYGDMNASYSLGLVGNLWRTEVMDPEFMTGSLTVKGLVDISSYQVDEKNGTVDGHWLEGMVALPVCYEIFSDKRESIAEVPYSLVLSLGPALSLIDGRAAGAGVRGRRVLGACGGADVYFSHHLSLGCQAEYFDHGSIGANLIYHF